MSEDPGACAAPAKEDVSQPICRDFILYKPPEDNPHGLFDEPRKIMLSYARIKKNTIGYSQYSPAINHLLFLRDNRCHSIVYHEFHDGKTSLR